MNQKGLIAILVVMIVVLAGATTYLMITRNINQTIITSSPVSKSEQQQSQSIIKDQQTTSQSPASSENNSFYPDWKVYRNDKYGFEIRYPENWKVWNEDNQSVGLGPINGQDVSMIFVATEKPIDEKILPYFGVPDRKIYDRKNTIINDISWEMLVLEGQIGYITHRNGVTYAVQTSWCEDMSSPIMLTFKFTK